VTTDSKTAQALNLDQILRLLPHRYPFLLVDRVLEVTSEGAVTIKNVSINEPFFCGHFPGRPVMPGVLIIEALAQSAAIFALGARKDGDRGLFMLTGLDKVRFRRQVIPGDQLRMEVRLIRHHPPLWKIRGEAHVAGELAAEAEISAMLVGGEQP
jgi:3-hydroxyacyl-[acyl-carrier-protein] dehydratase